MKIKDLKKMRKFLKDNFKSIIIPAMLIPAGLYAILVLYAMIIDKII